MSDVLNATRMHCPKYNNEFGYLHLHLRFNYFVTEIFCLLGLLLSLTRGGI